MAEPKLKIWNGNAQSFAPRRHMPHNGHIHAYGCAKSRADLCRMIEEWAGRSRSMDAYLRDYWSAGAWGNSMTGIEPERGLWVQWGMGAKPERVWPPGTV